MRLTLGLAHDENEKLRESAVKLLNELAPDMGQELCECFIVKEIRSLAIDESSNVRITVVQNLINVSRNVSIDCFSKQIFPLYQELTTDKEQKVRKTCADVVAEIAKVSPLKQKSAEMQELYFKFL
jgi:HEAT repeat protein